MITEHLLMHHVLYSFRCAYKLFFLSSLVALIWEIEFFPQKNSKVRTQSPFRQNRPNFVDTFGTDTRVVSANDTRRRNEKYATLLSSVSKCWGHHTHWTSLRKTIHKTVHPQNIQIIDFKIQDSIKFLVFWTYHTASYTSWLQIGLVTKVSK